MKDQSRIRSRHKKQVTSFIQLKKFSLSSFTWIIKMASSSAPVTIPQTHRALLLKSSTYPYDISVVQRETPKAVSGSAVIRVHGSGVLTYGGRVYSGKKRYPYPEPFVPGSASIGRVVEVGADATTLKPGQLVFFDSFITGRDNSNSLILHGLSSGFNPSSNKLMDDEWRDGTYAEYAKVRTIYTFPSKGGMKPFARLTSCQGAIRELLPHG
jgi:NADPH:quinone reductase-like Zn-dependent oxidoreductase